MGLYRNVSTTFWEDRKVVEDFTPEDKYFYLYLFTNPHTNVLGCYELGLQQAAMETGYNKETVSRLIERFQDVHKVILYDSETKEVLLLNWHKHNWTTSPKCEKAVMSQKEEVKSTTLKECIDTLYIPYIYPIPSNSIRNSNSISNRKAKDTLSFTDEDREELYKRRERV